MYAQVMRDQFQITEEVILTNLREQSSPDFELRELCDCLDGRNWQEAADSGESYRYTNVIAMMRTLWRDLHV